MLLLVPYLQPATLFTTRSLIYNQGFLIYNQVVHKRPKKVLFKVGGNLPGEQFS